MMRLLGSAGGIAGAVALFLLLGRWSPGLGCVVAFAVTSIAIGVHWWYAEARRWQGAHQKTQLALKRGS